MSDIRKFHCNFILKFQDKNRGIGITFSKFTIETLNQSGKYV